MVIRGFFLAALVAGATGCGAREDPCLDGLAQEVACGLDYGPSYDSTILQMCRDDPARQCVAGCVAEASCQEMKDYLADTAREGCGGNDLGACITSCVGCVTPLVLSFDGAPVRFGSSDRFFDFGIGASVVTDWPAAMTPWLALDRDGNGSIDDATELFGSSTPLRDGGRAANGFLPLRELDSDGDGRITPADRAWSSLLVWSDRDGDRASSWGELASLEEAGVLAIDLGYTREPRCDARVNCEIERAGFRFRDPAGAEHGGSVVDVYLRFQYD